MMSLVVHGRGGQGGVTLAKLIAGAYFLRGSHVQAFGVYGAERTGAPVEAFVRVDDCEIMEHSAVRDPDHVVVVDPTLVAQHLAYGMASDGWIIVNTALGPGAYADVFPGRSVAVVDATAIAVDCGLGTSALPIVNTALLGAVARVLGLTRKDVTRALSAAGLGGPNEAAALRAFVATVSSAEPGEPVEPEVVARELHLSFLDERVGRRPTVHTGAWAAVRPLARELRAACTGACPAGNDVRGFVQAAAAGEDDVALGIILETSPLPGICGRVCPAPCMDVCNRAALDGAVDVRDIERGLADRVDRRAVSVAAPCAGETGAEVAIVGSGPAGLSAAYHLARLGHPVELYEASMEFGGALRSGIPQYRLPRDVLERELAFVLAHGVAVHLGVTVDRPALEEIASRHAAVVVATGRPLPRDLHLEGARTSVRQALDLLAGPLRRDLSGETVIVAGGGTTAVDAARTALRLGAREVRIAYRRTREQMPAITEEVEEALEEGMILDELLAPAVAGERGGRRILTCRRMRLGDPDESGRPRPEPVYGPDGEVELACDLLSAGPGGVGRRLPAAAVGPT